MKNLIVAALTAAAVFGGARAEAADVMKRGETFEGTVMALSGGVLTRGFGRPVHLFGVQEPALTDLPWGPLARAEIDKLIGGDGPEGQVRCTVVHPNIDMRGTPAAECTTPNGESLAEAVIRAGFASVDREQLVRRGEPGQGRSLIDAETEAREDERGFWSRYVD